MLGVVVAGGAPPPPRVVGDLVDAELIVAADGGVRVARSLDLVPTVVVGDLDSAGADDLDWARRHGADVVAHDRRKDRTDLELALDHAADAGVDDLVVLGVTGGRVDHELGNWAAVAGARVPLVEVRTEASSTWVVFDEIELDRPADTVVSLQAWGGPAVVTATGVAWELERAELSPFEARGVSNEIASPPARVLVHSGVVLVTVPSQGR